MSESFSADVGSSGVIGVVDPKPGGLVLAVQGYEFYSHDWAEVPFIASVFPISVSFHGIEVVDSHYSNSFRDGHVQGLVNPAESTERIGGVHVGVDVDNSSHSVINYISPSGRSRVMFPPSSSISTMKSSWRGIITVSSPVLT